MNTENTDHQAPVDRTDHLLEHEYDGIQEYDNPLPRWWLAIFWITVVATPLYILFFHFGSGLLAVERYDQEMIAFYDKQAEQLLAMGEISENTLVDLVADPSMMNGGKKIFQAKCATCHGMFGEGGIGPNLTDDYWIHGAQFMDIYRTVREGVTEKGMLAWERQLRPAELLAVSSYAGSLLGTEPPNPKEPQGTRVARAEPGPVEAVESETDTEDAPTAETDAAPTTS